MHVNPNKTLHGISRPEGVDIMEKTGDDVSLITTSADGTKMNFYCVEQLVEDIPVLTAQDMHEFKQKQREEERGKRKRKAKEGFFGDLLSDEDEEREENEGESGSDQQNGISDGEKSDLDERN